jgi:nicotinate-nucleotide adenylyltransferase
MVRLAIEGEPTFAVSDFEVRRSAKSYSIDTVTALREQYGPSVQLYFIIGLDAFLDIGSWNRPQELLQACHFIVVGRPGQSFGSLAQVSLLPLTSLESVSQLDAGVLQCIQLPLFSETTLTVLRGPASAISASDIRCRLQKREGVRDLLPGSVESYIIQHDLYVEVSNRTHSEG